MALNPAKEHRGVLLGITKIDRAMRSLTPEERVAVARMCRDAVTSKASGVKNTPVEPSNPGLMGKIETGFMGIEVVISQDHLQLYCEDYMVSNQKIKELSAIVALRGSEGHLVIIGNCQKRNQRAAFVLDMFSDQQANEVIQAIQLARSNSTGPNVKSSIPPPVPIANPIRPIPQTLPSTLATVREPGTENSLDVYEPEPGATSFPLSSHPASTSLLPPHLNFGAPKFTNSIDVSPQTSRGRGVLPMPNLSRIQTALPNTAGVALRGPGHSDVATSISGYSYLADTATVSIPSGDTTSISKPPEVSTPLSFTSPDLHPSDASLASNHSNNTTLSGQCGASLPQSYTPVFASNPFNTSLSIRPNSALHLANSSTGIPLSYNSGLPGMPASGLSSTMNTEDGNSFRSVFNAPMPVIATSNSSSQHARQPDFPAHMDLSSGAAIPFPDHASAETPLPNDSALTASAHRSNFITVNSIEKSIDTTNANNSREGASLRNHGNASLPGTNTSQGMQECYENDDSLEQSLPEDQYEDVDNNPSDVITVRSSKESVNTTKTNNSGEAVSLRNHSVISLPGTNTSQGREECYENDQYEDVDNQDNHINAHEDVTYEDADAPSHGDNQVIQARIIRGSEMNGHSQEQARVIVTQRQSSLVSDNLPPPLPPRSKEMVTQSSSPSASNSPGINTPQICKPNTAIPTKPQNTSERQGALSQTSNIYGSIPGRPPPVPSVPPPLPPRSEVKIKKKISLSLPKAIGIRREKDKTKVKKSKPGKDKKAKEKGTLQYSNADIILMSKSVSHISGPYKPSGNYQAQPHTLPPPPTTVPANILTSTSQTADDSDDSNEFIYEGDEYYTSLGMNVLEAERISMKLPSSNLNKPSLSHKNDINNFLNNEYNYLGSIERISKARSLFPTQMQSLLRGAEALYDTHNAMYGELYAGQSSYSKIADVFKAHKKEIEMYKYYMMNAPQISNNLKELPESLKQSYPQLEDDIRGSWNRLHYYFMTLESMLDSAPEEDRGSVKETVEMLRDLHLQADSGILIDSVKDAPFNLHLRAPLLLHHSFRMTGPGLKSRDCRVLLFTELIVITVPKQEQYDYQMDFRIEQTSFAFSNQANNSFSLEVIFGGSKGKQVYSFRTSDEHVIEAWVKQIKQLQVAHAEKIRRERNKRYGLE